MPRSLLGCMLVAVVIALLGGGAAWLFFGAGVLVAVVTYAVVGAIVLVFSASCMACVCVFRCRFDPFR